MKRVLTKARRYCLFLLEYVFEKLRGLDFTLPAASEEVIRSDQYNGYCKTPEKHIETILKDLEIDFPNSGFLDVGCGKGAVLRVAKKFPFRQIAGIDLDDSLIKIARENMRRLHLNNVECIAANALSFERYGEYNVFFFFNPFSRNILEQVLKQILETQETNPRKLLIIYHHPLYAEVMADAGLKRISTYYDKLKGYETYIYCSQ